MADPLCGCTPCRLAKASRPSPHPARDRCKTNGQDSNILRLSSDLIGPVEPRAPSCYVPQQVDPTGADLGFKSGEIGAPNHRLVVENV
eukprot:4642283-Pyramimonas_sp.AAC.1